MAMTIKQMLLNFTWKIFPIWLGTLIRKSTGYVFYAKINPTTKDIVLIGVERWENCVTGRRKIDL